MKLKRFLKIVALSLLATLIIIAGFLYYKKDSLLRKMVAQIEEQTNTSIDYSETQIGISHKLPNIKFAITDLLVRDAETEVNLLSANEVSIALNPFRLLFDQENINVNYLIFLSPSVEYRVDKNGLTNWDHLIRTNEGESESGMTVKINSLEIKDGKFIYQDHGDGMQINLSDLEYIGEIENIKDSIILDNNLSFSMNLSKSPAINLNDYRISLVSEIHGNTNTNVYQFDKSRISLNALEMDFSGKVDNSDTGLIYSFDLNSIDQSFPNLLSVLRSLSESSVKGFDATGDFSVEGHIEGNTESRTSYPIYSMRIKANNGLFKLPSFPGKNTSIGFEIEAENKTPMYSFDRIIVRRLDIAQGTDYIKGDINLTRKGTNVMTSYILESEIENMSHFNDFTDLEIKSGRLILKSKGDFDLEAIEKGIYKDLQFEIDGNLNNFATDTDSLQIHIENITLNGNENKVSTTLTGLFSKNFDLSGSCSVSKPLQLFVENVPIEIDADFRSSRIDLNPYVTDSDTSTTQVYYPFLKGPIKLHVDEMQYLGFPIEFIQYEGSINGDKINIDKLSGKIKNSDFSLNGTFEDIEAYLNNEGYLTGLLDIRSDHLNMTELEAIANDPTWIDSTIGYEPIFKNLKISMVASSKSLTYEKATLKDNLASLDLVDDELHIKNYNASAFGGKVTVVGSLRFGEDKSSMELKSDFSNISIVNSLESVPFFRKLAYPLSFINGNVNTTVNINTLLNKDYFPILSEVNAFGLLETLDGELIGFKPWEKVNQFLGIQKSKDVVIKQSKNWVTVKNGWVQVDPFSFTIEKYKFTVKGAHSLNNELNYLIFAEVPTKLLADLQLKDRVGADIFKKINQFRTSDDASVGLYFTMTGDFGEPILKLNEVDLLSAGKAAFQETLELAKDSIRRTVDTLRTRVESRVSDSIEVFKDRIEGKINEKIDSTSVAIKKEIEAKLDSTVKSKLDSIGVSVLKDSGVQDSLKQKIIKLKDILRTNKKN